MRVLIADDSTLVRGVLRDLLQARGVEVVGEARDGEEAVQLARALRPDLVLLDLLMPRLDGVGATRAIMREAPTRILLVSAMVRDDQVGLALEAIQAGALDMMAKPRDLVAGSAITFGQELLDRIGILAGIPISTRRVRARPSLAPPCPGPIRCVAIGASTGGPRALVRILSELPRDMPAGVLIVQHVAAGFADGMARWLSSESRLEVRLARGGEQLEPGVALLAPDSRHMVLRKGVLRLNDEPPVNACKPSIDITFQAVASTFAGAALGVVLTGMGSDGALGAVALKQAGATVFAQDERTSAIFGMPRATIELGVVDRVLPIDAMAEAIASLCRDRAA